MSLAIPPLAASGLPVGLTSSPPPDFHERVTAYTKRLFPGGFVSLRDEVDPEFGDRYTIVTVQFVGTVEELVRLDDLWCRNLSDAVPEFELHYGLLIDPQ